MVRETNQFHCRHLLQWQQRIFASMIVIVMRLITGSVVNLNQCDSLKISLHRMQWTSHWVYLVSPRFFESDRCWWVQGSRSQTIHGTNCVSGIFIWADKANKGSSRICMSSVCRLCRVLTSLAISGESGCLCLQPAFIKLLWPALYI